MSIDPETKNKYSSLISECKKDLSELDSNIAALKKRVAKEKKIAPLTRVGIISMTIKRAEMHLKMNALSEEMMEAKNNGFLDATKKDLGVIFSNIDAIVTLRSDESLNFNHEMLDQIKPFNVKQRLNMMKYIKKIINDLIRSYGDATKWKWSFPEIWKKFAISGKNLFDFREFQKTRDPRMEFYYELQEFLQFVKDNLFFSAGENANKFRLSTKSPADMLVGIKLLEDLRRIASLTNDPELVKKAKSGIDSYRASIEAEEKAKESKRNQKKNKLEFFFIF